MCFLHTILERPLQLLLFGFQQTFLLATKLLTKLLTKLFATSTQVHDTEALTSVLDGLECFPLFQ